jgi:CelD/BcsL family acetyltransferase involved in cellulose biosynthesis
VSVTLVSASQLVEHHEAEWHLLAATQPGSAPFLDPAWALSFEDAFAADTARALGAWDGERLIGLALMMEQTERWCGKTLRILHSLTNVWSFRFQFLSDNGHADALPRLWDALLDARRWDVVRVDMVPANSPTIMAGLEAAARNGWNHILVPGFCSPFRNLPVPPASWDDGLKSRFKSNLRNRERRLRKLGELHFEVARGETRLPEALETFYSLEASGWKSVGGTAIRQRSDAKRFFDGLVSRDPDGTWISILSVDRKPIAAQLIRIHAETMFLLKVAYDEEYATCSPGQLITARAMAYGIEHGIQVFDFLGEEMVWKMDWNPQLRPNAMLVLCAPSLTGRYAYWTRYGIKELVKRAPGAVELVRCLRAKRPSR